MLRLKQKYKKEVIPRMKEMFGYKSIMAAPRIEKVVINTGFGCQQNIQESVVNDLSLICGQKAVLTKAKKSIASFKIRKGMPIGAKATLRKKRMDDFLERLINVALPRSRDFRGIDPKAIDGEGNLTIAIKEHISFPEILPEKIKQIFSFEVTVVTSARTREEGLELLKLLGFPIKKQ